jgi:hypothetical protein
MNFVRTGPRYLFFQVKNIDLFYQNISKNSEVKSMDFTTAIRLAAEESLLLFLTESEVDSFQAKDAQLILNISLTATAFLALVLNDHKLNDLIIKITAGPGQLVMRIPENGESVIAEIKKNYQAAEITLLSAIKQGDANSTIISFTEEPIKSRISSLKGVKNSILIKKEAQLVFEELRRDAIRYITHGLSSQQWSELKINIYDSDELYELEYQRLITILSDLEAGIILGESWTKDHAFALFSITAYQIRLFTFLSPLTIKKILFTLEYNLAGERLVDYDLFNKNTKINWSELIPDHNKYERAALARKFREEVMQKVSPEAKEKYQKLEDEISQKSL